MKRFATALLFIVAMILLLTACAGGNTSASRSSAGTEVVVPAEVSGGTEGMDMKMDEKVTVYASPTCGCCHEWIPYLEQHGFEVETVVTEDTERIKRERGIPEEVWSCHTAVVGDYYVEGHVPVDAIMKLLEDKPMVDGISLPGMPAGSPGMNGVKAAPFQVVAIEDGKIEPFMTI